MIAYYNNTMSKQIIQSLFATTAHRAKRMLLLLLQHHHWPYNPNGSAAAVTAAATTATTHHHHQFGGGDDDDDVVFTTSRMQQHAVLLWSRRQYHPLSLNHHHYHHHHFYCRHYSNYNNTSSKYYCTLSSSSSSKSYYNVSQQQQQQQQRTFVTQRQKRVAAAKAAAATGAAGAAEQPIDATTTTTNSSKQTANSSQRSKTSNEGSSASSSCDDNDSTAAAATTAAAANNNNNSSSSSNNNNNNLETQPKPTILNKQQQHQQPQQQQPLILDRLGNPLSRSLLATTTTTTTTTVANELHNFNQNDNDDDNDILASSSSSSSSVSPLVDLSGIIASDLRRSSSSSSTSTTTLQLMPTAPTDWTGYEAATPLTNEFMGRIVLAGRPLSIAEFMHAALTHPDAGYYTTATTTTTTGVKDPTMDDFDQDDYDSDDILEEADATATTTTTTTSTKKNELIGPGGDFVTAPEISQVFGECLGVWFYTQWQQQQREQQLQQHEQNAAAAAAADAAATKSFQWLECGPGRGSLLVDLLQFGKQLQLPNNNDDNNNNNNINFTTTRTSGMMKQFWIEHCSAIHLIEASPMLQAKQQDALEQWQQKQQQQTNPNTVDESLNHRLNSPLISFEFYNHKSDNKSAESSFSRTTTTTTTSNTSSSIGSTNDTTTTSSTTDDNSNLRHNTHHIPVHWHDSLQAFMLWQQQQQTTSLLPSTFAVCQEFLDALPIYSFEKTSEGYWRERLIDVALREDMMETDEQEHDNKIISEGTTKSSFAEKSSNQDSSSSSLSSSMMVSPPPPPLPPRRQDKKPRLRIVLAPEATPALKTLLHADQEGFVEDPVLKDAPVGSVVEVSPDSMIVMQDLAKIIKEQGGAALVIDYGQEGSTDSIRGFSKHKQVHFLSYPGQVDVTADVDFAAMRHAVNNANNRIESSVVKKAPHLAISAKEGNETYQARAFGPTDQGEFLIAMGMQERVIQLIERDDVTDEKAEDLYNAMVRLASSEEMGKRYKVMCIVPISNDSDSPPPGFLQ